MRLPRSRCQQLLRSTSLRWPQVFLSQLPRLRSRFPMPCLRSPRRRRLSLVRPRQRSPWHPRIRSQRHLPRPRPLRMRCRQWLRTRPWRHRQRRRLLRLRLRRHQQRHLRSPRLRCPQHRMRCPARRVHSRNRRLLLPPLECCGPTTANTRQVPRQRPQGSTIDFS